MFFGKLADFGRFPLDLDAILSSNMPLCATPSFELRVFAHAYGSLPMFALFIVCVCVLNELTFVSILAFRPLIVLAIISEKIAID